MSLDCNFSVRLLVIAVEPLRYLTNTWLSFLDAGKTGEKQFPLHSLLDASSSPVIAVLQHISHLLSSKHGEGRLLFMWRPYSECFPSWCEHYPDQVGKTRHVLVSVSAWVYKRHYRYWHEFPWLLTVLADRQADREFVEWVAWKWDSSSACCLRPGLARDLKKSGFTSEDFRGDTPFGSH
eukprot:Skav232331  [mRNA]  locus=scaffold1704:103263:103802:+ [translate_table: standard]